MLAQEYKKHQKKVVYPCYIQPKLDGYRMVFSMGSQVTTRTGKEYAIFKQTQLYKRLCEANLDVCLDGELYVHDSNFTFERYGVLRKQKNLTEQDFTTLNQIQYHVYDIIDETIPYSERLDKLRSLPQITGLRIVETIECNTKEEIDELHGRFVADGYEGSIVRNKNGKYKCKYRSFDLLKYKDFDDGEYKIVDYTYEKDNENKLVVWTCETSSGLRFNVQSKGTKEERRVLYNEAINYIGKNLWVQHFGLTAEGIPRFPKTARSGKESIRMELY
jgi:ATP-dependent DNA ligase